MSLGHRDHQRGRRARRRTSVDEARTDGTVLIRQHEGPYGRMRSRSVGRSSGLPEIVLVQGMAVADYLMPGLTALGEMTKAHLVELPGLAGSGEPPYELDLTGYAAALGSWLDAHRQGAVVLGGHSAGTLVAATAAPGRSDIAGMILAGPALDPAYRSWPRVARAFLADGRGESDDPDRSHVREWRRAGVRRLYRLVAMILAHPLEEALARVDVPALVLRGNDDRLSTAAWARSLAGPRPGAYVELPGAHSFPWQHPDAWVEPTRTFLTAIVDGPSGS